MLRGIVKERFIRLVSKWLPGWCVERTFASGNPPQGCTPPSPALSIVAPAVKAVSRGLSLHHPLTPFFKQLKRTGYFYPMGDCQGGEQDHPLDSTEHQA